MSTVQTSPSSNGSSDLSLEALKDAAKGREKEQNILSWTDNAIKRCRSIRVPFERQWYLNLAFYYGRQYVQWTTPSTATNTTKLYEPIAPSWRVRLIANKIRPIIRRQVSKLTQEEPQAYVKPQGTTDEAIAAAEAADDIAEFEMDELNYNRILRQAVFWSSITGTSFIKDWWDNDGDDPSGQQGTICIEPVNSFHVFIPEIQIQDVEGQPFLIHAMAKTTDWVQENYNVDVLADSTSDGMMLEQRFLNALGTSEPTRGQFVTVAEVWVKPCSKFDKGAYIVATPDKLLNEVEGWPYDHEEYPFSKIESVPTGQFWADSVITDLIPLQREYNRTRSQIVEAKNRMSKPQLLAPKGSVDPSKMTSEPGLVILYTPGFNPPTPLTIQSLPGYVTELPQAIQQDMDDISSQYEVAKGRTPPGVTAASAIAYLQEENDTMLSWATTSIEEATEKVGQHILSYVNQYWDVPRTIRVLGKNDAYQITQFDKDSIDGNTSYRVESGSAAPRSRAAKQAFIVELGQRGWITPDKVLKYLRLVETGRLYEEGQIDMRQVQRENAKMDAMAQMMG